MTLRLARPYHSVDEYLAAEGWSITAKGMVLVGEPELETGTTVRFEIVLASGEKPIRAEGRVIGYVAARGQRPGGVKVRFNRLGAASKSFIDQVLATRGKKGGAEVRDAEPMSLRPNEVASAPHHEPPQRMPGPISAPANREELLERLRERARRKSG